MSRDTSLYYSFLVLPPRKRRALVAVWDFCRAVDDAVDEVVPEAEWRRGLSAGARASAERQLAMWRAELNACYSTPPRTERAVGTPDRRCGGTGTSAPPQTEQGRSLQPYVREFNLPREPFDQLIDGVAMDLAHVRYPTFEALAEYCRRVASTVGLICIEIFGYQDPRARAYAVHLGMALQLTNIIRDVAADWRRGRVYLPAEDLLRFGVREEDLATGPVTPAVRDLLRFECERAREYYRRAEADLPPGDARSLVAAEIMGGIYFAILRRIERAGYDVFRRHIRVPRPFRAYLALRIWARTILSSHKSQVTSHKVQR